MQAVLNFKFDIKNNQQAKEIFDSIYNLSLNKFYYDFFNLISNNDYIKTNEGSIRFLISKYVFNCVNNLCDNFNKATNTNFFQIFDYKNMNMFIPDNSSFKNCKTEINQYFYDFYEYIYSLLTIDKITITGDISPDIYEKQEKLMNAICYFIH